MTSEKEKTFHALTTDEVEQVLGCLGKSAKIIVQTVFFGSKEGVTLRELMDQYGDSELSEIDFLHVIGKLNGKIFTKFKSAVYPISVANTLQDSKYALGKME